SDRSWATSLGLPNPAPRGADSLGEAEQEQRQESRGAAAAIAAVAVPAALARLRQVVRYDRESRQIARPDHRAAGRIGDLHAECFRVLPFFVVHDRNFDQLRLPVLVAPAILGRARIEILP